MDDQPNILSPADITPAAEPPALPLRKRKATEEPAETLTVSFGSGKTWSLDETPSVDPLVAALTAWAGTYDPAETAEALRGELAARGIETIDQFMGTAPGLLLAALNSALRRDVVSLVNAVAQARKEE